MDWRQAAFERFAVDTDGAGWRHQPFVTNAEGLEGPPSCEQTFHDVAVTLVVVLTIAVLGSLTALTAGQ